MNPFSRWLAKRRATRDLAAEMAEHVSEKIARLRAEGHGEEEAARLARVQFGNASLHREDGRSAWGFNSLEQLGQDLRFGCRILLKSAGFTVSAVIVLALGIGLNTAMFSAIKAVLLTALPYPEPERIVSVMQSAQDGHLLHASMPDFRDWRAQTRSIESMATYDYGSGTISGDFRTRTADYATVGTGFFRVIATSAAIGRTFSAAEQKPGGPQTVVLSYEMAAALYGMPAAAVGKTVRLNSLPFTVIGVMPPRFNFPAATGVWISNDLFPDTSSRSAHNYLVLGRLKPGVGIEQAQADMNVIAARLGTTYADDKDSGIRVRSLYDALTGGIRPSLYVLWGAVGLVLLIACVNISNLQLARAAARRKEMGMRSALGAARGRLMRQLLTENILLALAGGSVGLLLAEIAVRVLRASAPADIPRIQSLSIDPGVLLFTAALSLLAGLLFGVLPALDSSRNDLNEALKQSAGKGSDRAHKRWGRLLVTGQIALAMLLLSCAAVLLRGYWKMSHVDTGMSSSGVYLTKVTWPSTSDGNSVDGSFVRLAGSQMLTQIAALPGVRSVALVKGLPFDFTPDGGFEIEGRTLPADPHHYPDADYRLASADYFKVFGIPILRGRGFQAADERSAEQVAIVNQSFVREFFPNAEAVGKRIRFFGMEPNPRFLTIIGVIPDVRSSFRSAPASEVYVEYFQHAGTRMEADLLIRGPATLQPRIEGIITSLNRSTAVDFQSMDRVISSTVSRERFETVLLGLFAATALLLAMVGIYGLLSYLVTRRTSELGVRLALGASRSRISRLVLGEAGTLVAVGVAIGLVAALIAATALQTVLQQAKGIDGGALFVAAIAFGVAALLAAYLPAHRASRIEPARALRTE